MRRDPGMITTSTNRHLIQPTKDNTRRRRSELRESVNKGKSRSKSSGSRSPQGAVEAKLRNDLNPSPSGNNDRSQLVDLVVEDTEAEEVERVRARKEGGDAWNDSEQKIFVRTYDVEDGEIGDVIRAGYDPSKIEADHPPSEHAVSDYEEDDNAEEGNSGSSGQQEGRFGSLVEEENVWK